MSELNAETGDCFYRADMWLRGVIARRAKAMAGSLSSVTGLSLGEAGDPAVLVLFDYWFCSLGDHFWGRWGDEPVLLVLLRSWALTDGAEVEPWRRRAMEHVRKNPQHRVVFAANTRGEQGLLEAAGLEAIWCNHNAFVDEALFRPEAGARAGDAREFDAVYDARFARFKRNHLAAGVRSLLLMHYDAPNLRQPLWMIAMRWRLRHAHILNRHKRLLWPRTLTREKVAEAYRRARVGLCLSRIEGAMLASIQYLLSGLPVVTTPSEGERDEFFDPDNSVTVEATAEAVAEGVREMIARRVDPWAIRERTLQRMERHRASFRTRVIEFQEVNGVPECRRLPKNWGRGAGRVFTHKISAPTADVRGI